MAATPANSLTLISSGLADARIQTARGNPDINQFVNVVKKTTRWAAQWCRVEFDGSPEFGQRVSMTLPRIGELVTGFTLAVTMPDIYTTQLNAIKAAGGTSLDNPGTFLGPIYGWTNSLGHALIQQIELEIGGTIVETLDGTLLEILDELYESVESAIAKNAMIKRAPNGFQARTWLTPQPLQVFVPIPFWFSRPGVYTHALPLEALKQDGVRIHVTFRPISQLFYTEARVDSRTIGYNKAVNTPGSMWPLQNGQFWQTGTTGMVYSMNAQTPPGGVPSQIIPNISFPQRFSPVEAYALVEYISLDDYEAMVFRTAELTYHVEQHMAVPVEQTLNALEMRLAVPYSNPTKEILWVLQRPEVATYNAWFLFTRDLSPPLPPNSQPNPCFPSPKQYGYRSKITPHFLTPRRQDFPIGFLAAGTTRRVIDVPKCPLATDAINAAYGRARKEIYRAPGEFERGATLLFRECEEGVVSDSRQVVTEKVGKIKLKFLAGEFFQNNPSMLDREFLCCVPANTRT